MEWRSSWESWMKNLPSCIPVLKKSLNFVIFTLMFCRGRQRNVPKFKTHVQNYCFCSLNHCSVAFSLLSLLALLSSLIGRQLPTFKWYRHKKNRILPWNTINSSSVMIFFTTAWMEDVFTFLLGKSYKSGIKLPYVYARGVCEFRVS